MQDANGKPADELTLEDCPEIIGDKLDVAVQWELTNDVSPLAGK